VWIPCFVLPALLLYATEVVDHRSTNIILACYAAGLVVSVTGAAMALSAIRRHGIHVLSALRALGSSIIMVVGFILLSVFDTHL
jgi:cytochrome c biogenesis protein CcdA